MDITYKNVIEESGDLFDIRTLHPDICVLVHCIGNDKKLGKGIAKEFATRYPTLKKLLQNTESNVGKSIIIKIDDLYISNLITKPLSSKQLGKDEYMMNLRNSLLDMYTTLQSTSCRKIAMPKIGSGLDGMEWLDVLNLIIEITPKNFTVYIRTN